MPSLTLTSSRPGLPPQHERIPASLPADPLAALGASPASAKLLRFFVLHPTMAVHGRALQRLLGLGSASLQREVDRLLALDALERVEVGRRVCYRPVLEAKLWGAVMLLLSDTRDPVGIVRDALCDVSGIEAAFVFGSFARGDARPDSDVDVFVVETPAVDRRALHRQLAQVGLVLNREVNAVRYTTQALADRLGDATHPAHRFTRAALDGPKQWVAGSADRLRPLAAAAGLTGIVAGHGFGWERGAGGRMNGKKARGQPPDAAGMPASGVLGAGAIGAPPAGGFPAQVQLLLNANRLRPQPFSRAEVLTLWQKAVGAAHDAALTGLTSDNAVRLAYDAGHAAALALLAAHGLRTGGGSGHHEVAIAGAAGLGGSALGDLVPDTEEIRQLRHGSMYDPVIAGPPEVADALKWVGQTLPPIRHVLVGRDGTLAAQLKPYP